MNFLMRFINQTLSCFLFLWVVCACSQSAPPVSTLIPGGNVRIPQSQAYPVPSDGDGIRTPESQAYPVPSEVMTPGAGVVYAVPSPDQNTGVVIGKIFDEATKKPLGGYTIYLASIIWMTPEPAYSYGVQENSSPHTLADEQGRFAIGNVPPGNYIVMVWTPFSASVIMDPRTGKELDVRVEAGKILDLGDIEGIDPFNSP